MTILEGPCIFMSYLKIDYGAILVLPLHFFWATVVPIRLQANHKNLESKCFRKKEKLNYAEKHQSKVKGKIMKYYILKWPNILFKKKKSRILETKNLLTDADRRTDTILERLHEKNK